MLGALGGGEDLTLRTAVPGIVNRLWPIVLWETSGNGGIFPQKTWL